MAWGTLSSLFACLSEHKASSNASCTQRDIWTPELGLTASPSCFRSRKIASRNPLSTKSHPPFSCSVRIPQQRPWARMWSNCLAGGVQSVRILFPSWTSGASLKTPVPICSCKAAGVHRVQKVTSPPMCAAGKACGLCFLILNWVYVYFPKVNAFNFIFSEQCFSLRKIRGRNQ